MQKEYNLSKNQKIIFDLIDKSGGPMKAYSILFNVQKKGIKAPLQVYRALDKYFESFELLISDTFSQLSQIEKAVAFET